MTETGLLVAEVAFLVLLYVFIWSVVRSSRSDLSKAGPQVKSPTPPAAATPAPAAVPPAPAVEEPTDRDRQQGHAMDLSRNISPRLIVERSPSLAIGAEYPLEAGLTIGRGRSNGICLSDQFVSFMHARIYPDKHFFFIEDLGSTNGTFLNGRPIETPTQLKVRDEVVFGDTTLRYEE